MAKNLQIQITSKNKVVTVAGHKIELSKKFQKAIGDKGILKKDVQRIAYLTREHIQKNIASGKRFDTGGAVAKLKPATVKRKGFSKPLMETGKMVLGVMTENTSDGAIVRMKNLRYKGGVSLPEVMKYTNEGDPGKRAARPVFGINKKNADKIVNHVFKEKFSKLK